MMQKRMTFSSKWSFSGKLFMVDYNRSENARREFKVLRKQTGIGKTKVEIECPFCGTHFWAYVWSISGGGKKCENKRCGAMHTSSGIAYPVSGKENGHG